MQNNNIKQHKLSSETHVTKVNNIHHLFYDCLKDQISQELTESEIKIFFSDDPLDDLKGPPGVHRPHVGLGGLHGVSLSRSLVGAQHHRLVDRSDTADYVNRLLIHAASQTQTT